MKYHSKDFSPAKEYGHLMYQYKNGRVHVIRLRLFDNHNHNWIQDLIRVDINNDKTLWMCNDQCYDLNPYGDFYGKLNDYKRVWFNGVLIYKRPWWKFW